MFRFLSNEALIKYKARYQETLRKLSLKKLDDMLSQRWKLSILVAESHTLPS